MLHITSRLGSLALALLLLLQPAAGARAGIARAAAFKVAPVAAAQPAESSPLAPAEPASGRVEQSLGQLPLYFVQNQGQLDEQVAYYLQGSDKTVYFTSQGLTFALSGAFDTDLGPQDSRPAPSRGPRDPSPALPRPRDDPPPRQRWAVKLDFLGANPDARPEGLERTEALISYFTGRPEEWHTGLPTYAKIIYRELWPGIDLLYYGAASRLKYEFLLRPGADPGRIRLAYRGASAVRLDEAGRLQVSTPAGGFSDEAPLAYQESEGGQRVPVDAAYAAPEEHEAMAEASQAYTYGFRVGAYDRSKPLVLDPAVLLYCGYIGGATYDYGRAIVVDRAGNAYVTGYTDSSEATFPVTVGPDLSCNGGEDAFVAKVNAAGTALAFCSYVGGSGEDEGQGIAVDGLGNAYVTGYTDSSEATFPITSGPDLSHNGSQDAFVAKVSAMGTALFYCGYIGGSADDYGYGIAVDGAGKAYVTGHTDSSEATFPMVVGPDVSHNGNQDAFVAQVNAAGNGLLYCGYVGGAAWDGGRGIAIDEMGNAYITGYTSSREQTLPVIVGPDLSYNGSEYDAFVAKVNAEGTGLSYCGYIGGNDYDYGYSITVDGSGNAYVAGYTYSTQPSFPVTVGPDLSHNGAAEAFVAKVNPTGAALLYCGYIGGETYDYGYGIAVDGAGNANVTGWTWSSEKTFPVRVGPDLTHNGGADAFVAKVSPTGATLLYCGYIGGPGEDEGQDIAVDAAGNAYVTGDTRSSEQTFTVTVGPDLSHNGYIDVFVAKVNTTSGRYERLSLALVLRDASHGPPPTPTPRPPEELHYDDGTCEGYHNLRAAAVRFSLSEGRQLTQLRYHLKGGSGRMQIVVYDANWSALYSASVTPGPLDANAYRWWSHDITPGVAVGPGDFYVAMIWPSAGANPHLGEDTNPPHAGRSYGSFTSGTPPFGLLENPPVDLMIRAVVQ